MAENLNFTGFNCKIKSKDKKKLLLQLKKINKINWPPFLTSFKKKYKYSFDRKLINKYINIKNINIIGIGGSALGIKAIYNFLFNKIKKKIKFLENPNFKKRNIPKGLNIIISKSGNTLETIVNANFTLKTNQ